MITGSGCLAVSALRRLPPIADAIALRYRSGLALQRGRPRIQPRAVATQPPGDLTRRIRDPITASGKTAHHRIPIAV
jgi:hypothetical protein